jgi:hypothetical protein
MRNPCSEPNRERKRDGRHVWPPNGGSPCQKSHWRKTRYMVGTGVNSAEKAILAQSTRLLPELCGTFQGERKAIGNCFANKAYFRVPKACPEGVRFAFLAFLRTSKINKLRVFNGSEGSTPPSSTSILLDIDDFPRIVGTRPG